MAATALFLACKVEDSTKKISEIATVLLKREAMLAGTDSHISEATPVRLFYAHFCCVY